MRSYLDAKSMAKSLASSLAEQGVEITHSRALELVAQQFGSKNWNVLSAEIAKATVGKSQTFQRAIPVFRIFSEEKAREFYLDYLGFTVDWEHRFEPGMPLYMQISRSDLVIHLSEHHGDSTPGSAAFLEMTGIREYLDELKAKDYKYLRPEIGEEPWGLCFNIRDGFGNGLRFCERQP